MKVEKTVIVNDSRKLWIFLLVFSLAVMAVGVYLGFIKSAGYVRTTGVVVGNREETRFDSDTGTKTTYYPTVSYTVDGKEYTGTLDIGGGYCAIGEELKIQYDPDDPSKVNSYSPGVVILIFVLSVPLFALSVYKLVFKKKDQPSE